MREITVMNKQPVCVYRRSVNSLVCAPQRVLQNIENFMKDVYKDRYGEDISDDSVKTLYSVAVSIFAIGGMVGGFSGGTIANRFGRSVAFLI